MVVLDGSKMTTTTLGGHYAQGAPALKIVQKRFLGLHQFLSPVYNKELKEQLVSSLKLSNIRQFFFQTFDFPKRYEIKLIKFRWLTFS